MLENSGLANQEQLLQVDHHGSHGLASPLKLLSSTVPHTIAKDADWNKESSDSHSPRVVIRFDRSAREWAAGRTDDECNYVIREISYQLWYVSYRHCNRWLL